MRIEDYQSGDFERRFEYRSFLPSKIRHPWIISNPTVLRLNSEADRCIGELNAFAQLVPDIDFFISMYIAKEASQSGRIEGTQTNIEDAFKDIGDVDPEKRDDWDELQNYILATNQAIGALEKLPLSSRLLCEAHAILMKGVRGRTKLPGQFRSSQNWIGVSLKDAVFVPPHHEHVPDLMGDLEHFLHDQDIILPPLIRIAIAHYQFETIHPFLDGNGRLGRLMIALFLSADKQLIKPALYLSDYLERNKTAYVDHLMAVRQGNHLQEWLVFFLHGVVETAKASSAVFRAILELKQQIERDVLPTFSARRSENARLLMRRLYKRPVINISDVQTLLGSTVNTASDLVADLARHGILRELTGQRRNRLYIFDSYVRLFA
jgi:Fic family protein